MENVLQEDVKRQLPPLPQDVLVQHLMWAGVPGQALEINEPPAEVHFAVAMQTPGAPPAPVQAPVTLTLGESVWERERERVERVVRRS
jgi:hypothetical protein